MRVMILKRMVNHHVFIEVCSAHILVACLRINAGLKGDSFRETHRICESTFGRTGKTALITSLEHLKYQALSEMRTF